jgi:hypothetical protein
VLKNKVRSQSAGAILYSLLSSLPSSLAFLLCDGYATVTNRATVLVTLVLFFLLLLCKHRLGLVDSPSCQSFKRSSMTSIITSTPTNKQPPHQITLGLSEKAKEKYAPAVHCGSSSPIFANLRRASRGCIGVVVRRAAKGKIRDKQKTGAWEDHVKVQAPPLLRSRVQFRGCVATTIP